jgi:hypothetical protein
MFGFARHLAGEATAGSFLPCLVLSAHCERYLEIEDDHLKQLYFQVPQVREEVVAIYARYAKLCVARARVHLFRVRTLSSSGLTHCACSSFCVAPSALGYTRHSVLMRV